MKTTFFFIFISLTTSIFAQTTKTMAEPIPGADIKVGRKPPGGGQIIATGVTDETGSFEVKNLETGDFTYYFEYGIKENGIEGPVTMIVSKEFTINNRSINSKPTVLKQTHGVYEITFTISTSANRGSLNTSRSNIRGSIVTSRSNIKN